MLSALDAIDLTASVEEHPAPDDETRALDSLAGGVFVERQRETGDVLSSIGVDNE